MLKKNSDSSKVFVSTKLAKDAFSTASKTYEKKSSYFSRDSKNYVVLATVIRYIHKLIYSRITDQNELI